MPNKSLIANGILVAALAWDMYAGRKNKAKYDRLVEDNIQLREMMEHAEFIVNYLSDKLCENEIPLTEFDMIALHNPM